jgi:protein-L-isoaspartate O-methyltransferase
MGRHTDVEGSPVVLAVALRVRGDHAQQELLVVTKINGGYRRETVIPVRFVPMKGKVEGHPP